MTRRERLRAIGDTATGRARRLARAVFGDRIGLCLFLATLLFFALYWRVGVFITDNYTLYNALPAVADGRLWIDAAPVGGSLDTPGMHTVGARAYGRNYGEVVLAVPLLWAVRGVSLLADLHVALIALWHGLALALLALVARHREWPDGVVVAGSLGAVASFVLNVSFARRLPDVAPLILSLQLETAVAAGLTAVVLYRLLARRQSNRVAVAAGAAVALSTPIAFWAAVPKRHVLTGLVAVGTLYAFDRSRSADAGSVALPGVGSVPVFRAGAYALVALYAWVHAAEALFLLVPLALVDLPSAPDNGRRSLATVGVGFALALVPFVLTNVAISGDPISPPRTLPSFSADAVDTDGVFGGGGGGGGGGGRGLLWLPRIAAEHYRLGLDDLLSDRAGLVQTLVASSDFTQLSGQIEFRAANLAVLESAPVLGALVALAVAGVTAVGARGRSALARVTATDLLALSMGLSLLLLYLPRLPLHVQVTARYVLPLFPLAVYGIARFGVVRRVLTASGHVAGWSFAGGVLLGGPLVLVAALAQDLAVGEAVQFHGAVNLVLAAGAALALIAGLVDERADPVAAAALGLAAAGGTVFVLLSGVVYFSFVGPFVLPVVDLVSDAIAAA